MVRIAAGARDFSLFVNVQVGSEAHPATLLNGNRRLFSGAVKLAGHEADHVHGTSIRCQGQSVEPHIHPHLFVEFKELDFGTAATARRTAILAQKLTVTHLLKKLPTWQGILK
jgi:uncharacterized Zn-finger protein